MPKSRAAVSSNVGLRSSVEAPAMPEEAFGGNSDWKSEEPWMAILIEELGNSFRVFAKESGRLSRLVQAKKKCSIPSEGFNLQVSMRMECVERAFHTYMRRKDELLSYILATAHRAQRRSGTQLPASPAKPNSGLHIEPKVPDKQCVSSTASISTDDF
jgi:hypothetical protein